MNRSILALLIAVTAVTGLSAARAQERTGPEPKADTKAETAAKPEADTRDPGRTATEAVTNPAAVPPTEGAVGSGKPPTATPPATGR